MPQSAIHFCDVCQGSIPPGEEIRLPNGAVYCRACCAHLANRKPAAGGPTKGAAAVSQTPIDAPVPTRLPAWTVVTVCVTILLLALSIGVGVFLFTRLQKLNDRVTGLERDLQQAQQQLQDNEELRRQLQQLLARNPNDPDFRDQNLMPELLKLLAENTRNYKRELDTTLDEIDRGGRVAPRRRPLPRDAPDTGR